MLVGLIVAAVNIQVASAQGPFTDEWLEAAMVNVAYQTALCQPYLNEWLGAEDVEESLRSDFDAETDERSKTMLLASISASQQGKLDRLTSALDENQCSGRVESAYAYLFLPLRAAEPDTMFRLDSSRE